MNPHPLNCALEILLLTYITNLWLDEFQHEPLVFNVQAIDADLDNNCIEHPQHHISSSLRDLLQIQRTDTNLTT